MAADYVLSHQPAKGYHWNLVDRSITADILIDEPHRLAAQRGYPAVLRCDNGPELACDAMAGWAGGRVGLAFEPPGATATSSPPTAGSATSASTSTASGHFPKARVVITDWKDEYPRGRHSPLGYQAPVLYAASRTHQWATLTTSGSVLVAPPVSRASRNCP